MWLIIQTYLWQNISRLAFTTHTQIIHMENTFYDMRTSLHRPSTYTLAAVPHSLLPHMTGVSPPSPAPPTWSYTAILLNLILHLLWYIINSTLQPYTSLLRLCTIFSYFTISTSSIIPEREKLFHHTNTIIITIIYMKSTTTILRNYYLWEPLQYFTRILLL